MKSTSTSYPEIKATMEPSDPSNPANSDAPSSNASRVLSRHSVDVVWEFQEGDFRKGKYSREHTWTFDGGITVAASPSPHVVPPPWSNPAGVDPEEAFVAAISSCHMLTFLYLASKQGFHCLSYRDHSVGCMTRNEHGVPWVSKVELAPSIQWDSSLVPSAEEVSQLHDRAHHECFIANSVKTQIIVLSPSLP